MHYYAANIVRVLLWTYRDLIDLKYYVLSRFYNHQFGDAGSICCRQLVLVNKTQLCINFFQLPIQ